MSISISFFLLMLSNILIRPHPLLFISYFRSLVSLQIHENMNNLDFVILKVGCCNQLQKSTPCFVALVGVRNGLISERYFTLINPVEAIFDFTSYGLKEEDVRQAPLFADKWPEIEKILLSYPIMIEPSNNRDADILHIAIEQNKVSCPPIKYMGIQNICRCLKSSPSYSVESLCKDLSVPLKEDTPVELAETWANILIQILSNDPKDDFIAFCGSKGLGLGEISSDRYAKSRKKSHLRTSIKDIVAQTNVDISTLDETHPFFGKVIVVTGAFKISGMNRNEAAAAIAKVGGLPVTKATTSIDYLIYGVQVSKNIKEDGLSDKQRDVIKWRSAGHPIEMISEQDFLDIMGF